MLEAVAAQLAPGDVLLDVGGAGRISLPLAARCREVLNVEPSPGMVAAFREAAREAGIRNARVVEADWLATEETGDVAVVAHVTYFVREIVPFLRKLDAATRKRVAIIVGSVPPTVTLDRVYRALFDEPSEPGPGHRELLPVLWDLGLLPDVRVLSSVPPPLSYPTAEAAVSGTLRVVGAMLGVDLGGDAVLGDRPRARFDDVFEPTETGYQPRRDTVPRTLLISWAPGI